MFRKRKNSTLFFLFLCFILWIFHMYFFVLMIYYWYNIQKITCSLAYGGIKKKMKKSDRYNIGILIGGVHTYFPKEHIRGITEAARELNVNVCFFLGTQTKDFF